MSIISTLKSTFLSSLFKRKSYNFDDLEKLKEILLNSDFGTYGTNLVVENIKKNHRDNATISNTFVQTIQDLLSPYEKSLQIKDNVINVILVSGVNGGGKTTTVGKLGYFFQKMNKKVMFVACDLFRSAAEEQIKKWADQCQVDLFLRKRESEHPAAVAYQALEKAQHENIDILIMDTSGRLGNRDSLMRELSKMIKVIKKIDSSAPHHSLFVLDANIGQNALQQAEKFIEFAGVTGVIVTKMDISSKAGVLVPMTQKCRLPIHFVCMGEKVEDLDVFSAKKFSSSLIL